MIKSISEIIKIYSFSLKLFSSKFTNSLLFILICYIQCMLIETISFIHYAFKLYQEKTPINNWIIIVMDFNECFCYHNTWVIVHTSHMGLCKHLGEMSVYIEGPQVRLSPGFEVLTDSHLSPNHLVLIYIVMLQAKDPAFNLMHILVKHRSIQIFVLFTCLKSAFTKLFSYNQCWFSVFATGISYYLSCKVLVAIISAWFQIILQMFQIELEIYMHYVTSYMVHELSFD